MLIGLPGSGKSTWIAEYRARHPELNFQVVSSDDILEEKAQQEGLDYADVHEKYIGFAIGEMERRFKSFLNEGAHIIHDQTNLSKKTRKKHLDKLKGYTKSAVVFTLSDKEWKRRYDKRKAETAKDIPDYVIKNMIKGFEFPSKNEGFVSITHIKD